METYYGPVNAGDPLANALGFSSGLFEGYLYVTTTSVMISLVTSLHPNNGHFENFVRKLLDKGFTVKIPTPLDQMRHFVEKHDFEKTFEKDKVMGRVKVWIKCIK